MALLRTPWVWVSPFSCLDVYSAFLKTRGFILIRISMGLLNNPAHSLLNLYKKSKKKKNIKSMPQFSVDSTPCNLDIFEKTLLQPGLVAHTCNSSTCKSEAGGLLLMLCQPGLHSKTLPQNNTIKLKGKKINFPGKTHAAFPGRQWHRPRLEKGSPFRSSPFSADAGTVLDVFLSWAPPYFWNTISHWAWNSLIPQD